MRTQIYDAFAGATDDERRDAWDGFDEDWKRMLLTDDRFAAMFPDG
jgi:hypothetical protein